MGSSTDDASTVRAPGEANPPTVTATVADTATAAIAHGGGSGQYIDIGCDDETATLPVFWVMFGPSDMATPATDDLAGPERTMGPYQGVKSLKPASGETHYRVISTASGFVRSYPSSHGGAR